MRCFFRNTTFVFLSLWLQSVTTAYSQQPYRERLDSIVKIEYHNGDTTHISSISKYVFSYLSDNRVLSREDCYVHYSTDKEVSNEHVLWYVYDDEAPRICKTILAESGRPVLETTMEYDKKGNLTMKQVRNVSNEKHGHFRQTCYGYTKDGRIKSSHTCLNTPYRGEKELVGRSVYEYTKTGVLKRCFLFRPKNEAARLNVDENFCKNKYWKKDGQILWDEEGRFVLCQQTGGDTISCQYNEKALLKQITQNNALGTENTFFDFDEKGNLITACSPGLAGRNYNCLVSYDTEKPSSEIAGLADWTKYVPGNEICRLLNLRSRLKDIGINDFLTFHSKVLCIKETSDVMGCVVMFYYTPIK